MKEATNEARKIRLLIDEKNNIRKLELKMKLYEGKDNQKYEAAKEQLLKALDASPAVNNELPQDGDNDHDSL